MAGEVNKAKDELNRTTRSEVMAIYVFFFVLDSIYRYLWQIQI